jgi:indole-3-glycerol phosphate synthase
MLHAAREASLEPFVEVASRQEINELRAIYEGIIAINNADIQTSEIEGEDIARSVALIERKDPRLWVSASRIGGPEEVHALAAAGFDGILVGTHLLLADDLLAATTRMVAAARA